MTHQEDDAIEKTAREYLGPKATTCPWEVYYNSLSKLIKVFKEHKRVGDRSRNKDQEENRT